MYASALLLVLKSIHTHLRQQTGQPPELRLLERIKNPFSSGPQEYFTNTLQGSIDAI
jgi:hypothetical protein